MDKAIHARPQPSLTEPSEEPVFALAVDCGRLFEKHLNIDHSNEPIDNRRPFADYQRLFWKWAQYVGVFAAGKASLDWRLRRNDKYRELFLLALDMLRANLHQLLPPDSRSITSADSDSSDESDASGAAFDGIKDSISQLNSLGISIRQPVTSRLESKVKGFAGKRTLELSHLDLIASLALERLYPDATPTLRQRLVKHMVNIHARLMYWESHSEKLSANRGVQLFRSQNSPDESKLPATVLHHSYELPLEGGNPPQLAAVSETEATTIPSKYPAGALRRIVDVKKTRGGGVSTVIMSKVDFPPPPKAKDGHICWYCKKVHSSADYESKVWWRNHTNSDLMPYVCLSDNCLGPKTFSSSGRWAEHMASEHGNNWTLNIHESPIWRCDIVGSSHQDILNFRTLESLEDHFRTFHQKDVDTDMPDKRDEDTVSNSPQVACPLCYMTLQIGAKRPQKTPKEDNKLANSTFKSGARAAKTGARVRFTDDPSVEAAPHNKPGDDPASLGTSTNDTVTEIKRVLSSHIAEHLQRLAFLAARLHVNAAQDGDKAEVDSLAPAADTPNSAKTRSTVQLLNEDIGYVEDPPALESNHGTMLINQIIELDDLTHSEGHEELTKKQKELYSDTLVDMVNLASIFKNQGRWKEAEAQEVWVMKTRKRVFGEEHPDTLTSMTNLASTYRNRGRLEKAEDTGMRAYESDERVKEALDLLEHVVAIQEKTLDEGHPDRLASQHELSRAYQADGRVKQATALLEYVVAVREMTLDEQHPDRLASQHELARAHEADWANMELEGAITTARAAVNARADNYPDLGKWLNNLGLKLHDRYSRSGAIVDLEEAIAITRQAIAITPEDHPDLGKWLNNLGLKLHDRYLYTGAMADLEEAIAITGQAIAITPEDHPDLGKWLNNLGLRLHDRYLCTSAMADLEEAIAITRRAIAITPEDHPDLGKWLNNLGLRLHDRYSYTGAMADLEEAIRILPREPPRETSMIATKTPYPKVSIDELQKWVESSKTRNAEELRGRIETKLLLNGRDFIFLIDNSKHTKGHKQEVKTWTTSLAYLLKTIDPDGIDVANTSSPQDGKTIKKKTEMSRFVEHTFASEIGGDCSIEHALDVILAQIKAKWTQRQGSSIIGIRNRLSMGPRTLNSRGVTILVFTDGVWDATTSGTCGAEKPIMSLIEFMQKHDIPRTQVLIQFVRLGSEPRGIRRLKILDDELKKDFDIVDTKPVTASIWDILIGPMQAGTDNDAAASS